MSVVKMLEDFKSLNCNQKLIKNNPKNATLKPISDDPYKKAYYAWPLKFMFK